MKYIIADDNQRINTKYIMLVYEECEVSGIETHRVYVVLTDSSRHCVSAHESHEEAMKSMDRLCEELMSAENIKYID